MAREVELKKQMVFNTGTGVAKPVWNNANRVNHANHFIPRPIQLNIVRQNVNYVKSNVNTGRANVDSVKSNVNTGSFNINTVKAKQPINTSNSNRFSPVRPQGNWGTAVKTSAGYNWRRTRPISNYNSGSNFIRTINDHPLKNMEDRGIFDSRCSGYMTGNKDNLDDLEECKGGSVTFGGSKGYITVKGRIRVGKFETPTQGKTSGKTDISPEGLEAAETLAKVLTQRTKIYTRKVKTGLRRKLDANEVSTGEGINTGFIDVNTAFDEVNSDQKEQASLAEIVRLQAQEEAENARKVEQQRHDALIAKRVQDELELSETQNNRMAQVQEATNDDFAKKMVELINEKKRLYKEQREREREIEETDL
ncbi:hypothetical protein Tco_1526648 [Tanacetum coccineum]